MRHPSLITFALLYLAVVPAPASSQSRSEQTLSRRVDSLERRLVDLESRLGILEKSGPQATPASSGLATNAQDLANWRRLRENMSYNAVRRLLGEPIRISGGTIAFWYYHNGAQVTFHSGRLRSWTEP
jgi:hypothetical protein